MKNVQTNNNQTSNNFVQVQADVKIFLSQDGETLIHLLPGNGKIQMPINFYKSLFGVEYTPKSHDATSDRPLGYGFIARPSVYFSRDSEYLIHRVPGFKVSRHVNYYKKILNLEFSSKSQHQPAKKAQA